MIFLFWISCIRFSPMNEQNSFSPALIDIVQKLEWKYTPDCMGIEALWFTKLPKNTNVQVMIGPKTQNPHFDDDALIVQNRTVDDTGTVHIQVENTRLPTQDTFINLRVWGVNPGVYEMLVHSQKKGGFPIAQGPNGPYGWAETTISPCSQ